MLAELAPTAIYSSDLCRATQTAGAADRELTGLPVRTDARLREIHVGTWEGLTIEQIAARSTPTWRRATWPVRTSAGRRPGRRSARWRSGLAAALDEIGYVGAAGSTVVVVMHGMAARGRGLPAGRLPAGDLAASVGCTTAAGSPSTGTAPATTGGSLTTT